MKKIISTIILKIIGWKVVLDGDIKNLDRCVLVTAPHTANMDYILGILTFWYLGKKMKVVIKDDHTKAFYGKIVEKEGGIGINRAQANDLVNILSDLYKTEDFSLIITPEGTRNKVRKWRLGFLEIAKKADVKLVTAGGDYKRKEVRLGKEIANYQNREFADFMGEIEEHFKGFTPKFPEQYNTKIF